MVLIEEHYRKNHFNLVKRMSFRAGDAAEDVVQEAYARALKYYKSYDPKFPFDVWLKRILNNCLKEQKNLEKGHIAISFEEEEQDGTVCNQFSEQMVAEIGDLIDTKSAVAKDVLHYHFNQGYTAKEVSELTEYTYSNCHQIIRRFREELREIYGTD